MQFTTQDVDYYLLYYCGSYIYDTPDPGIVWTGEKIDVYSRTTGSGQLPLRVFCFRDVHR